MSSSKHDVGVLFFGPRIDAAGGIATVLRNYRKTVFWSTFRCRHLATMRDFRSRWCKIVYEPYRVAAAVATLAFGPRPCAVSIHTAQGASFYRKFCYLLLARVFRVPAVLHIHPASFVDFYRDGRALRRRTVELASRLCDQVIFLSEPTRAVLSDVFPLAKTHVLPNPVDTTEFAGPASKIDREHASILFLGWIIREKGVYDLVEAMPKVLHHYPNARFTFAGNQEIRKLRQILDSRGLSAAAEVPGWATNERRLGLLRSATMLVLPSYSEGLPNVILEAMASGLPIITTPVGAIPAVLEHGQTALFVEAGDAPAIASAILSLLGDASMREKLADAAFDKVRTDYSLDAVSNRLADIYSRYQHAPTASQRSGAALLDRQTQPPDKQ